MLASFCEAKNRRHRVQRGGDPLCEARQERKLFERSGLFFVYIVPSARMCFARRPAAVA